MSFGHLRFFCWEFCLDLYPIFKSDCLVFWCLVSWVLYIFRRSALCQMWGWWGSFPHSVGCCFVLFTVSFALQKLFSFRRSHLLIVGLSICATGVIFRTKALLSMHLRLLPTFSSVWLALCWGLWFIWTWVLCRVIDMDLFAILIHLTEWLKKNENRLSLRGCGLKGTFLDYWFPKYKVV